MENVEAQVQKHLESFCKILPAHVGCWRLLLQESVKPVQVLLNLCEQQRHVKKAKITNFEDFDDARETLLCEISKRAEEELSTLKDIIDKLNKYNNDLKNKLLTFERSTLNLDWNEDSDLIRGNGIQPALVKLLQSSLDFLNFFFRIGRNINENFKILNLEDEKSIKKLQAAFNVNLDEKSVTNLIALTQYVDNEIAIL